MYALVGGLDSVVPPLVKRPSLARPYYSWPSLIMLGRTWPGLTSPGQPWRLLAWLGQAWPDLTSPGLAMLGQAWPCLGRRGQVWAGFGWLGQACLGHTVYRVTFHGLSGMDVDDVDNCAFNKPELRQQGLDQEIGCSEIGIQQVIPLESPRITNCGGIEPRRVIDQQVKPR